MTTLNFLIVVYFYLHICLSMAWGRGTDKYMNGSYVTETCLHDEHTTCNIGRRSLVIYVRIYTLRTAL